MADWGLGTLLTGYSVAYKVKENQMGGHVFALQKIERRYPVSSLVILVEPVGIWAGSQVSLHSIKGGSYVLDDCCTSRPAVGCHLLNVGLRL